MSRKYSDIGKVLADFDTLNYEKVIKLINTTNLNTKLDNVAKEFIEKTIVYKDNNIKDILIEKYLTETKEIGSLNPECKEAMELLKEFIRFIGIDYWKKQVPERCVSDSIGLEIDIDGNKCFVH